MTASPCGSLAKDEWITKTPAQPPAMARIRGAAASPEVSLGPLPNPAATGTIKPNPATHLGGPRLASLVSRVGCSQALHRLSGDRPQWSRELAGGAGVTHGALGAPGNAMKASFITLGVRKDALIALH